MSVSVSECQYSQVCQGYQFVLRSDKDKMWYCQWWGGDKFSVEEDKIIITPGDCETDIFFHPIYGVFYTIIFTYIVNII